MFSHVALCETKLVCETLYTLKHALKHRDLNNLTSSIDQF